jgi:hypothetical protein
MYRVPPSATPIAPTVHHLPEPGRRLATRLRTEANDILREMAYVYRLTEHVKGQILADRKFGSTRA